MKKPPQFEPKYICMWAPGRGVFAYPELGSHALHSNPPVPPAHAWQGISKPVPGPERTSIYSLGRQISPKHTAKGFPCIASFSPPNIAEGLSAVLSYPHFTDEKTEAQKGKHHVQVADLELKPRPHTLSSLCFNSQAIPQINCLPLSEI